MTTQKTTDQFFAAVESAGGQVIHNRRHTNERGQYIPEIRLSTAAAREAEAARRQRIIDGMVAEHDRLVRVREERAAAEEKAI